MTGEWMAGAWVAAADGASTDPLLSYGLSGLIAAIALTIVRFLYVAQITELKAQLAREIARGDRLETALATVNEGALRQAREAVEAANHAVADAIRRNGGHL